jgi:DNA-binding transcriptional LysR family regulator
VGETNATRPHHDEALKAYALLRGDFLFGGDCANPQSWIWRHRSGCRRSLAYVVELNALYIRSKAPLWVGGLEGPPEHDTISRCHQAARRAMDRVTSMLSFVKVVELSGFSSAARQLNLATSIVTTHVKSLEDRLGVRLLNRTTRNVSVTEAGKAYYERCIQILSEIEEAEEAAQVLQAKPRGVLRLNTSSVLPPLIAPSIAEYNETYPDVTVRLTATGRMIDLVEEGFDLAIRYVAAPDSSLIVRRLASYPIVVCASPEYLAKRGHPKHPSDLAHHNCLIYYDSSFSKDGKEWMFTGPDGEFSVRVSGTLETNSPDALRAAVLSGQGLLMAPAHIMLENLRSGALVPVLSDFLCNQFSIDALYPHREHLPAKVRTFIDVVAKNLRKIDWDPCSSDSKSRNSGGDGTQSTVDAHAPESQPQSKSLRRRAGFDGHAGT